MQPKMIERHTRALSWVFPGGHTQKMERLMSSSVSCMMRYLANLNVSKVCKDPARSLENAQASAAPV